MLRPTIGEWCSHVVVVVDVVLVGTVEVVVLMVIVGVVVVALVQVGVVVVEIATIIVLIEVVATIADGGTTTIVGITVAADTVIVLVGAHSWLTTHTNTPKA
jgi:hypothetical protein